MYLRILEVKYKNIIEHTLGHYLFCLDVNLGQCHHLSVFFMLCID